MKVRIVGLFVAAWVLFACGDDSAGSSESTGTTTTAEETAAETTEETATPEHEEATAPAAAGNVRDIHGIHITLNDDGTISLSGTDKWGSPLDTVYADKDYFQNAVPVLERSVTEEQYAGLTALVAELARTAPVEATP